MQRITIAIALLLTAIVGRSQTATPSSDARSASSAVVPATQPTTEPSTAIHEGNLMVVGEESTTLPSTAYDRPIPAIKRAVIISVDGLRPDLLLRANTPNMHKLFESGSFSFWARTTAVSVTLPSHTSMLTGNTPIHHGIEWNRDLPLLKPIYPAVPTIFELAHRVGYTTAMVAGKSKFSTLAKPGTIDWMKIPDETKTNDAIVAREAVDIIRKHKPQVLFVHFPSVDNVGHAKGWATAAQMKAIEGADTAIGEVLTALDDTGVRGETFILITADHGGAVRNHGPDDPRSGHIPWIAVGPGIQQNVDLTIYPKLSIDTEDTFATVCWLMGIPIDPKNVDGKPIVEIQFKKELLHEMKK